MSSDSNSPPKAEKNNVMRGRDRRDYSIAGYIRRLGWPLVSTLFNLGQATRFALTVIGSSGAALRRPSLIIKQLKVSGVNTLIIILVAGIFVGFVLGLQFYVLLARYGQVEVIGAGVALTLFRELGPVSSGLLFVGCACTSITASIGLKKASEQIAAMEIMAVDPIARVTMLKGRRNYLCRHNLSSSGATQLFDDENGDWQRVLQFSEQDEEGDIRGVTQEEIAKKSFRHVKKS